MVMVAIFHVLGLAQASRTLNHQDKVNDNEQFYKCIYF